MCQSFSEMHIAVPVQWQLRSQRCQLSITFKMTCTEQFHLNCVQRGQCETLVTTELYI